MIVKTRLCCEGEPFSVSLWLSLKHIKSKSWRAEATLLLQSKKDILSV